jgi:adhesin transport system outer membrane protein
LHKFFSSILTVLACSLTGLAPACAAETLRQAVAAAMERFPEIQGAQHRREAARAQVGQARAEFLPSLNGTFGEGRERSRNVSTRGSGEDVNLTRREADLSVTQLLFDGGAAGGQVRRFAARAEGAEFGVIGTAEDVAFRASQVFLEVRRLRDQLAIARDNVATHERTLSDVNLLADSGKGRRADAVQAQARRALAISSVDQISGQLAQAEAAFRYLVGRPPGELAPPPSIAPRLPERLDAAVSEATASHPIVKSAEKEIEAAQYDRESARARQVAPRVTLEAGASRNRDIDGIAGPNQDQYAMLRLRYNFFRGFGDSERVRETEARIDQAISELSRVRIEIERDVRQAWEGLLADRSRVNALEQYARASADVVEAYRMQFQLGQRTLLDVLNAENERYSAASNLIAAQSSVSAGELRVLSGMGRLMDALGVSVVEPPTQERQPAYQRVLDSLGISLRSLRSTEPAGSESGASGEAHGR